MDLLTLLALLNTEPQNQSFPPERTEVAASCFKSGEQDSGMNKICYYDCLGSTVAITVRAYELCPLTIH